MPESQLLSVLSVVSITKWDFDYFCTTTMIF
uniref:Uncharacterized protein n=1 Tax=Anguilla anguilla TaxID=7936 RepID=A0A0E9UMP4_ANGAN